jgi:predicted membrane-bound spermidine synthase
MNIQSDQKTFDRALQKVELEMEWSLEKSNLVRVKLERQIHKEKVKSQSLRLLGYVSTVAVTLAFLFLVISQLGNPSGDIVKGNELVSEKLYKMEQINGVDTPVLTEEGMEHVVYPMDAYKKISTITGEPNIFVHVDNKGNQEVILTQAFYPTSSEGRFISVHNTVNNKGSVEEMLDVYLPDFPLYGRKVSEIEVAGQSAVLYEPTTHYGSAQLFIVTENYVYYMSNSGLADKVQGDANELVQLANLFNFEAGKKQTDK